MSLDLDPTEQQLAAALGRLAAAYVPEAGDPPTPAARPDHRRWLALAVAASLIALLVGIWAVAARDTEPVPATVPPTVAPLPSAAADEPLAIIDPVVAPGRPTTSGAVDRHVLRSDQFRARSAVRRNADGSIGSTLIVTLNASIPRPQPTGFEVAGRPALRTVSAAAGRVIYLVDAGDLTLTVMTELAEEDLVDAWLEAALTGRADTLDIASLTLPAGFEPLPSASSTAQVEYLDGATAVSVQTTRFSGPIEAADWLAVETPGASTTGDEVLTVSTDQGQRYLLWQPDRDVLVTVTSGGDLAPWAAALRLSTVGEVDATPTSSFVALRGSERADERELDRIVLGETSAGRFAYVERLDMPDGTCWSIYHEVFGGTSRCSEDGAGGSAPSAIQDLRGWCGLASGPDGSYEFAIVLDRPDATIEIDPTMEIERGLGNDGTPYVAAWVRTEVAPPASELGVLIDGERCLGPG